MIPVSQPSIKQSEINYVTDAVKSGWVSSLGSYIDEFERQFAEYCGAKFALTVSNGTVGLHLALTAFGIGRGDEVIVPDLTFVATANAVRMTNAKPVMVDVCRDTYCMDPEQVVRMITGRTKAIMPVHLYGHPANMSALRKIANTHNIYLIEDAAEAHGATIEGIKVGALGDCGVFSFYGNKIITSGEGGMITTNDENLFQRLRYLRDHAMSKEIRYWHTEVGYNYRMTNIQAALGLSQLKQIDEFISRRAELLQHYRNKLEPEGIECNPSVGVKSVNWITCAFVDGLGRERRDLVISRMREQGVDSRPFFFPLTRLPMYRVDGNPVSNMLSESGFNLPTFVDLRLEQVNEVCSIFLKALDEVK